MYEHIITEFLSQPWAILESKLSQITGFLRLKANGGEVSQAEIDALKVPKAEPLALDIDADCLAGESSYSPEQLAAINAAASTSASRSRAGSVMVLPLMGTITQRANMLSEMSGGTSAEMFSKMFTAAVNDPVVKSIVIECDSPGGSVAGIPELADVIYNARGVKPVVAMVNSLSASAAYWLASQCSEIVVTPSGSVGSIGVYMAHEDVSKALESEGVNVTLLSAGKYKTEGNPYGPLTDEAKAEITAKVNDFYGMFVKAVARGRGVTPAAVREGFGQGRMVLAGNAVAAQMADRVGTMSQTLSRLGVRQNNAAVAIAEDLTPEIGAKSDTKQVQDTPASINTAELLRKRLAVL